MRVAGIIVEYNPLHNGHIYHINKTKEITNCDLLIAVMSPNFVQRGQVAIIDKWIRAKEAINQGVDIVLELPTVYTLQSATVFAKKAIEILNMAKVDSIVFGSEINNIECLKEISEQPFNIDNFKANMKKGYSYPKSYSWMEDSYGPNDILAIAYLNALKQYPNIQAYSIKRTSDYASDELSNDCSGFAIREAIKNKQNISNATPLHNQLVNYPYVCMDDLYPYIQAKLLTIPREKLSTYFLMDEGIEAHLIKCARNCYTYKDFINAATTRRYTTNRIQRILCHLLLEISKDDVKNLPDYDYIRPLAFSKKGQQYLKELKKNDVKVVDHFSQNKKEFRDIEYKASVIYSLTLNKEYQREIRRKEICGQYLDDDKLKKNG